MSCGSEALFISKYLVWATYTTFVRVYVNIWGNIYYDIWEIFVEIRRARGVQSAPNWWWLTPRGPASHNHRKSKDIRIVVAFLFEVFIEQSIDWFQRIILKQIYFRLRGHEEGEFFFSTAQLWPLPYFFLAANHFNFCYWFQQILFKL